MKCNHDGLAALEDCLECRIAEMEAERAIWGNEFSAVCAMKEQLRDAAERIVELNLALDGYHETQERLEQENARLREALEIARDGLGYIQVALDNNDLETARAWTGTALKESTRQDNHHCQPGCNCDVNTARLLAAGGKPKDTVQVGPICSVPGHIWSYESGCSTCSKAVQETQVKPEIAPTVIQRVADGSEGTVASGTSRETPDSPNAIGATVSSKSPREWALNVCPDCSIVMSPAFDQGQGVYFCYECHKRKAPQAAQGCTHSAGLTPSPEGELPTCKLCGLGVDPFEGQRKRMGEE